MSGFQNNWFIFEYKCKVLLGLPLKELCDMHHNQNLSYHLHFWIKISFSIVANTATVWAVEVFSFLCVPWVGSDQAYISLARGRTLITIITPALCCWFVLIDFPIWTSGLVHSSYFAWFLPTVSNWQSVRFETGGL